MSMVSITLISFFSKKNAEPKNRVLKRSHFKLCSACSVPKLFKELFGDCNQRIPKPLWDELLSKCPTQTHHQEKGSDR